LIISFQSLLVFISENFWEPRTEAGMPFKGKPRKEDRPSPGLGNREVTKCHKHGDRRSGRYQSWPGAGV